MFITKEEPEEILLTVEWPTIFFFIGLFIVVGGLIETGLINSWAGGVSNPTLYGDVFMPTVPCKCINKEIAKGNNRYNFNDAYSEDGQAAIKKGFKPDNFYLTEKSLSFFTPNTHWGLVLLEHLSLKYH